MSFRHLATKAARTAARLRADLGIGPADAVCPFDLAEYLGVVTWFASVPSLEGMYSPEVEPSIIINAERPPGRRRHTCAHELGHHVFEHGLRLDQLAQHAYGEGWQPEEFMADRFAVGLLMPKLAVESALTRRSCSVLMLTAEQAFVISQDLGVSYRSFINHLERTLGVLAGHQAEQLRRAGRHLSRLRARIAGFQIDNDLVLADKNWGTRPIDVEASDVILVPTDAGYDGDCISYVSHPIPHLRAVSPGVGRVSLCAGQQPTTIRVSRRNFTGLARYRHLEDPDYAF